MNKWLEAEPTYRKLEKVAEFNLSLPCVVVTKEGDVMETVLSGLSNHLKPSSALSNPLMVDFFERAKEIGLTDAMNEILQTEEGEEFAELWDQGQKDIANDTLGTMDDVTRAIETARDGFNSTPKKMLVIQIKETEAEVLLVSPPK